MAGVGDLPAMTTSKICHLPKEKHDLKVNSSVSGESIKSFETLGFCIVRDLFPAETIDALTRSISRILGGETLYQAAGSRELTSLVPAVADLARSAPIAGLLESLGSPCAFLVKSLFFDKQPGANWKVPWHQDLTITVKEKKEMPGFGPWSEKAGLPHVQPPASVLERMITLRLHLDECGQDNGPLRVLPGSHRSGVLSAEQIRTWRQESGEVICSVQQGDVLVMRPLLLHASSLAVQPRHRRVTHLEFATDDLPAGLEWSMR